MKELNELVELAKKATPGEWSQSPYDTGARFCAQVWDSKGSALVLHDGKGEVASNDVAFIAAANPCTILAIAEAFRALEQRAEAAEAKLAELEKQEPIAWIFEDELPENYPYDEMYEYSKVDVVRMFPVFGPAPAINLADLVPPETSCVGWLKDEIKEHDKKWLEMLRNIEEQSK